MKKTTAREILATNVEKLLERNGLTKQGFCLAVGISRPALNDILNQEVSVGVDTVEKIANYFQLETYELLVAYGKGSGKATTPGERPYQLMQKLSEEFHEVSEKINGIPEDILELITRQDDDVYDAIRAMMRPLILNNAKEEEE